MAYALPAHLRACCSCCCCVCCCSSYSKHYASIDDKPTQVREDGLPISARMVPSKPLMVSQHGAYGVDFMDHMITYVTW
jgi:hypothetical protein